MDQQATSVRPTKRLTKASTAIVEHPPLPLPGRGAVQVVLNLTLPPSCHLTEGAPSTWQVYPGVCGEVQIQLLVAVGVCFSLVM